MHLDDPTPLSPQVVAAIVAGQNPSDPAGPSFLRSLRHLIMSGRQDQELLAWLAAHGFSPQEARTVLTRERGTAKWFLKHKRDKGWSFLLGGGIVLLVLLRVAWGNPSWPVLALAALPAGAMLYGIYRLVAYRSSRLR